MSFLMLQSTENSCALDPSPTHSSSNVGFQASMQECQVAYDGWESDGFAVCLRCHLCLPQKQTTPWSYRPVCPTSTIPSSGLSSSMPGKMLSYPFLRTQQVTPLSYVKCYHRDDLVLFLLPCPLCVANFQSDVCTFAKNPFLCGNIKSNPGSQEHEMLTELLSGQYAMTAPINEILHMQNKIEAGVGSYSRALNGMDAHLSTIGALKTEMFALKGTEVKLENNMSYCWKRMTI